MTFTKQKTVNVSLHVLCWLAFLFLPYVFFLPHSQVEPDVMPGLKYDPKWSSIGRDLIANIFLIIFFYANFYVFIPKFYIARKHLYALTAQCKQDDYDAVKDELVQAVDSFKVIIDTTKS